MTDLDIQKIAQLVFEMSRLNGCSACGALDRRCQVRVEDDLNVCQTTDRLISPDTYDGPHHADEFEWSNLSCRWHLKRTIVNLERKKEK